MTTHQSLPQLGDEVYLTDGGIETDLIFHHGLDLPEFASFPLLDDPTSEAIVRNYFLDYLRLASESGHGLILETATWRASGDWGELLGYDAARLREANERSAHWLRELCDAEADGPVVVSGCVGPRGDAYTDLGSMTAEDAARYHAAQIEVLADSGVDVVSALTITNTSEAIGIVHAAQARSVPAVISFTVETDGRLPDGTDLTDAIRTVDEATDAGPAYYMINCAHPDHFDGVLRDGDPALSRIGGVRANASRLSHAELDEAEELDDGDPAEFGVQLAAIRAHRSHISVLGGCCGTDVRHIAAIASAIAQS